MAASDTFAYKRDAKLQQRLAAEMSALLKQPHNSICADCGNEKTVRFCSVKLGVFLCNRCYGLHRNLGAHITRGKCIGLDAWSPEEVDFMRANGNVRVNSYYEASIPPGLQRPTASSTDNYVSGWIRDKYERRKYIPSNTAPGESAGFLPDARCIAQAGIANLASQHAGQRVAVPVTTSAPPPQLFDADFSNFDAPTHSANPRASEHAFADDLISF